MEIVFGAVSSLIVEVGKYMFGPINRQVSYFFNHEKKVKTLREQVEQLQFNRDRVQQSVNAATRNGDLNFPDVQKWLIDVNKKIAEELEELTNDAEKAKKRCFVGLCPNFISRYHLSKKAEAEVTTIAELLRQADEFIRKGVSHRPDPQQIVAEIVETSIKGFETFRSREDVLQGILEALKDPNVQRVGVYGMGGVGKTMLVKEVATNARKHNLFDAVAIATISNSKKIDIKNVQAQIAEALGVKLEAESESGRATELRQRLKNAKGVLIILDDIWVNFKLEDVGILFEVDHKISTERHKLLLTSRNGDLLSNFMKVEKNFEVRVLSQEEGIMLFAKIVGEKMEAPVHEHIASDMVKRCNGLPVAISAIANALKPLNLNGWKDALRQIKRSNPTNLEGIEEGVYLSLELSYNHLRSEEARRIFLLCGLMPQGSNIDVSDLINYSWGLDLLGDVRTLDEARLCVSSLVDKLKSSSLLLSGDKDGRNNGVCVKVHDIVRDVSISIASKSEQMFVVDDEAHVEELLKKGKLMKCTALSLPYSDIQEVPLHMLQSAELELLLFFKKHEYLEVPDAVIKEDNKLKVLDLSGMSFQPLPSSFIFLTNLRTLCLKYCRLRDVTIIGKLKKLEILSFVGSDIDHLPEQLAELGKLRLLDLSRCTKLKVIPANLISQLCRLEELYMHDSFNQWDKEGNASVAELKHLIRLIALDIHIPNVQKIPENLFSEKLERYNIIIGDEFDGYSMYYTSRTKLMLSAIDHLDQSIEILLKKTENLYLRNVELCHMNFETSICHSNLTRLVIQGCNNMRNLFTSSMARGLVQLKCLEVSLCKSMIEIIARDEEEIVNATEFKLPSLARLELYWLSKLKSFSCKTTIEWPSLTTVVVWGCDQVMSLFANSDEVSYQRGQEEKEEERKQVLFWANEVTFPKLETLTWYSHHYLKEIWRGKLVLQCFPNLKYLNFSECPMVNLHIEYMGLFPSLEKLKINYGSIKEILQGEGSELALSSVPKLSQLKLSNLYELRHLWDEKCEPVGPFFSKLMTLQVDDCRKLKKLVPSTKSFPNLVTMDIAKCDGLINMLTHSVAKSFVQLKTMRIAYCTKMKGIIGEEEANDSIVFKQLMYLELNNLPSLQNFCLTKCNFVFPSLDELIVAGCPQLKTFCHGALSTPKLQSLQLSEEKGGTHWKVNDGDLNNAIQQIYQQKVAFSGLDEWDFTKFPEFVDILNSSSPQTTLDFRNLTKMRVCNCKSTTLGYLFTPSMALCLVNLNELEVENCLKIEQVIAKEAQAATCKIILPRLRCIFLKQCSNLTSFCVKIYSFECSNLSTLLVVNCPKMVTFLKEQENEAMVGAFFNDKVDFPTLHYLVLTSINIQTIWEDILSTNPSCVQNLWNLNVTSCGNLKYVMSSSIVQSFVNLSDLKFQDCEKLEAIIMTKEERRDNLTFPKLSCLRLEGLPKLKSLCFTLDSDKPPLFDRRVSFPYLREIEIAHLNNVKNLWDNQVPADSFYVLESLQVKYCSKLLNIFSSKMPEVHELQGINVEEIDAIKKTGLREQQLLHLPKLKLVRVSRCWNLEALFPLSVARGLVGLKELDISFCGMAEVVSKEQGSQEINNVRLEFPKLTMLKLHNLPKLRSFYTGMCTILDCPMLKKLNSIRCNKLKMFASEQLISHQEINMLLSPFSIEVVVPKLEALSLNNNDIEMIEDRQFSTRLFDEIKTLHVQCCHDESQVFQFSFLQRFHNLEKLVVRCGKFKDLFPCRGLIKEENYGGALPRIKCLQMDNIDLRHIHKQSTGARSTILENLEALQVWNCDALPSLAPLLAYFRSLQNLDLWNCKGMVHTFRTSTCGNLVQLKKMRVRECYMAMEIVAEEAGDEGTSDITFDELEHLELDCLPSLTTFYSGNNTLKFPSLVKVIVKQCPGLKIFSKGAYTPKLEKVDEEVWEWNDKEKWAGDLNSTIQQLYAEKAGYRGLNYLDFSKFPELMDIWNRSLQEILDFKNLESLQVCNYNNSGYLFTPSMALGLQKLCTLKVQNCTAIEHIIAKKGFDGSEQVNDEVLFPWLDSVLVESCPTLISFFLLGRDTFECAFLNEITVIDCPMMVAFTSAFSSEQKKDATVEFSEDDFHSESFFTEKVLLPSLVHLKLSSTNIQKIWKESKLPTVPSCVQHLTELIVEDCGNLRYLWPSSMVKSCAQIETLEIRNCKLINGVIFTNDTAEEERIAGSGVHFEFPYMRKLVIENCPSLYSFITNSLTRNETVTNISVLWNEKVALHSLETLKLRKIATKAVWQRQYLTAQFLKQLRRISIMDCDMIKEIITCVADEVRRDGIVFNQLKYLELGCLPNLESFCSGECTLEFPSLKDVFVKVCPNMKTFSVGETSTPKLQRLQLREGEDEELFEGGLNTTIQKFSFCKKWYGLIN